MAPVSWVFIAFFILTAMLFSFIAVLFYGIGLCSYSHNSSVHASFQPVLSYAFLFSSNKTPIHCGAMTPFWHAFLAKIFAIGAYFSINPFFMDSYFFTL